MRKAPTLVIIWGLGKNLPLSQHTPFLNITRQCEQDAFPAIAEGADGAYDKHGYVRNEQITRKSVHAE